MPVPVVGGRVGRTDQGVDISGSPGAQLIDPVPGVSQLVGKISNWYAGQPFYWFKVLTGKFKDRYWYASEQVDITVPQGGQVSEGQSIGRYAASGSATEFGWATASGSTAARAAGDVNPVSHYSREGQDFLDQIIKGRSTASGTPATPGTPMSGGITRPTGAAPADSGDSVKAVFAKYQAEVDTPRAMPQSGFKKNAGWAAPFTWWKQSFLARWEDEHKLSQVGASGAIPGPVGSAIQAASGAKGQRWKTVWSQESDGGSGACGAIGSGGMWFSELSTVPRGTGSDFAALGHLPCMTELLFENPANGRSAKARKRDVGAGSSFLPVGGIYPALAAALGVSGGKYDLIVSRTDGGPLHPVRGTPA
jgi:hypothetical protein